MWGVQYAELKSDLFRSHNCFQPGFKRYITVPKEEAKLNRLICKWSLVWAGFCANQLSRCFPVLVCIHILFVNVYAWLSLRLDRVSSYPLLTCYLWFHSLRRSPRRRSACSLWPAALRSSLHTTSPENFWPGSPRSSCRPRPGLSAPSRTRTESLSCQGKNMLSDTPWREINSECSRVLLVVLEGYVSVWQRERVFYFPVDCILSVEVLLIELWVKQIT